MSKNKIYDLDSLDRQIAELETKKLLIENRLSNNWQYLKSDYVSIIKSSILHKSREEGRSSFIYWLFNIPEFKSSIGRTAEKLTVKLENVLVKLIDKIAG